MIRRYRFKMKPSREQASRLDEMRLLHQRLYNAALEERIDCFAKTGKTLTAFDQSKSVTVIRRDDPDYAALSFDSAAQTVKRLDQAFKHFFRRAKAGAGKSSGFPKFKAARFYPGFDCRESGKGWKMEPAGKHWRVRFKGLDGWIRARGRFPAPPKDIRGCTVTLEAGVWWLSVIVEIERERTHGVGAARLDWDIEGFAVMEIAAKGPCGPSVSAGIDSHASGNTGEKTGSCEDSPSGDPGFGDQPQGRRVECRPLHPSGDPGFGDQPQDRVCFARHRGPSGDPGFGDQPQVVTASGFSRSASGDPGFGDQPQGGVAISSTSPSSGDPGFGDQPQAAGRHRLRRLASGDPGFGDQPQGVGCVEGRRRASGDPGLEERVRDLQRKIARCVKGSNRRQRLGRQKARMQARQARRRREALHRYTTALVARHAAIEMVSPDIAQAVESGSGDARDWGAQVDLKALLNRVILELSPGTVAAMLDYKMTEADGTFDVITDPDHATMIGNTLVAAAIENRKLKRSSSHHE